MDMEAKQTEKDTYSVYSQQPEHIRSLRIKN